MKYSLKELVSPGNIVGFVEYRKGNLWYRVYGPYDIDGIFDHEIMIEKFEFPVPIDDIGDGIFKVQDKAILFMRYIRKHIEVCAQS